MVSNRLDSDFYQKDVLWVAPNLLGKILVRQFDNGSIDYFVITEVEAYRGEEDQACHARKGRTTRTETMYLSGGNIYMYLIYGMYWMLNIVTGPEDFPQAVLIRGTERISGPGRLTKFLQLDKSFNKENLISSERIWILSTNETVTINTGSRIGIDYAGPPWNNIPWRFYIP